MNCGNAVPGFLKAETMAETEKIWCDDEDCSPARLAGRKAARRGITDAIHNRPLEHITQWLVGHYEEKRNLYRLDQL